MHFKMMLAHQLPYANLVQSALYLCETMLERSSTLYPFAVLSIDSDVQMVFAEYHDQDAQSGMIEELEQQLSDRRIMAEDAIGLLVYAATIQGHNGEASDAVVLSITDSGGNNTITIYPYEKVGETGVSKVRFGTPFTCDFTD